MKLKTEVMTYNGKSLIFHDVKENALQHFIDNLPPEYQDKPIHTLPKEVRAGYIRHVAFFMLEGMNNEIVPVAQKAMVMLSHAMYESKLSSLTIQIEYAGTKNEVKTESFLMHVTQGERLMDEKSEYAQKDAQQPGIKFETFLNQDDKLIEMHEQCIKLLRNKESTTLMCAAGLTLLMDYMSLRNTTEMSVNLKGLERGEEKLNESYHVFIQRQELNYTNKNKLH